MAKIDKTEESAGKDTSKLAAFLPEGEKPPAEGNDRLTI